MPSGRTFCEHDLHKICGPERTKRRHQVLHTIQKLGLTREERIICGCMFLFSAGKLLMLIGRWSGAVFLTMMMMKIVDDGDSCWCCW